MAWIYLLLGGLCEVLWSTTMKLSNGFTHIGYTIWTVLGLIFSMVFLALAMRDISLSIAYPVWTGIGAVGAILVGVFVMHNSLSPLTWFFVALLVIGLIGIKVTSGN